MACVSQAALRSSCLETLLARGFGSQTPWYNNTGICTRWAHELAAALHHDYGHEVLNVGQGFLSIVDSANQLFRGNVAGLQPDVVLLSFSMGHEVLMTTQAEVAAKIIGESFVDDVQLLPGSRRF